MYKYVCGVNHYYLSPFVVNARTAEAVSRIETYLWGELGEHRLLLCLVSRGELSLSDLTTGERELAGSLARAGLLREASGRVGSGDYQLISERGQYLLIDGRINFPGPELHRTYVGVDSYLLLYYLDAARLGPESPVLDLGTGTGIAALHLSRFSHRVTAVDVDPDALALSRMNRRLNRACDRIEIREEDFRETLARGGSYEVVVSNPPFVALPEGLEAPLYARGGGPDGLDELRSIFDRIGSIAADGGQAVLVADLPGDARQPHFVEEIQERARRQGLGVDVFIDGRFPRGPQAKALASLLRRVNPDLEPAAIVAEIERFQKDVLRAEYYYLTTLQVRIGAGPPRVRMFHRYQAQAMKTSIRRALGELGVPAT